MPYIDLSEFTPEEQDLIKRFVKLSVAAKRTAMEYIGRLMDTYGR